MQAKLEKSAELFNSSYNCSQAVFATFGEELGLDVNTCLKTACAFGAGMAGTQSTCGAVTGALMAIGLKYGNALNESEDKKKATYALSKQFMSEFIERHSSLDCSKLLATLKNDTEPSKGKKCTKFVTSAVEITDKLLKSV